MRSRSQIPERRFAAVSMLSEMCAFQSDFPIWLSFGIFSVAATLGEFGPFFPQSVPHSFRHSCGKRNAFFQGFVSKSEFGGNEMRWREE
jgi:hypothetical protein